MLVMHSPSALRWGSHSFCFSVGKRVQTLSWKRAKTFSWADERAFPSHGSAQEASTAGILCRLWSWSAAQILRYLFLGEPLNCMLVAYRNPSSVVTELHTFHQQELGSHLSIYFCSAFSKACLPAPNNPISNGAGFCLDVLPFCLDSVVGFAGFQGLKADKAMVRV